MESPVNEVAEEFERWHQEVLHRLPPRQTSHYYIGVAAYQTLSSSYLQELYTKLLLLGLSVDRIQEGEELPEIHIPIRGGVCIRFGHLSLYILFNKIARNLYKKLVGNASSKFLDPLFVVLKHSQDATVVTYSSNKIPHIDVALHALLQEKERLLALSDKIDTWVLYRARREKIQQLFLSNVERVVDTLVPPLGGAYYVEQKRGEAYLHIKLKRKKQLVIMLHPLRYATQIAAIPLLVSTVNSTSNPAEAIAQFEGVTLAGYGNNITWKTPTGVKPLEQ